MITLEVQLFFYINSVEGATVQYLFLKIPNSVLVCKRQEVEDAVTDVVVLEVIHHVSPITLRTCIQRKIVLNVNSLTLQFVEKFYQTGLSLIKIYIFLLKSIWSDLDLFVGGDGTEDDLCKALGGKHPETDASYHLVVLHQGQALVFPSMNLKQWESSIQNSSYYWILLKIYSS